MYTCSLCKEKFDDTFVHSQCNDLHRQHYEKMAQGIVPKINGCFCGGTVSTIGIGESGWETSCGECNLLYAED